MEWCIEHFVVKIVSVVQIGANKVFVNSNQSLLLCNHALTHLFPNFTMSPLHSSTAYSVERKRCWTDVFRMIGNYICVKNLESIYHQGFTKPILMSGGRYKKAQSSYWVFKINFSKIWFQNLEIQIDVEIAAKIN